MPIDLASSKLSVPEVAILVSSLIACVGTIVFWLCAAIRIRRMHYQLPDVRSALALPIAKELNTSGWPAVAVVIPAHNEAKVIEALARSLKAQDYPPEKITLCFALDRCTDQTEQILRNTFQTENSAIQACMNVIIHHVANHREGWAGKVNAVWDAVAAHPRVHDADELLFADADTVFDPSLVRSMIALRRSNNAGLISLLSTLTQTFWFERWVQPATSFELVRQYHPLRVNQGPKTRALANGQFMLFSRDAYFAFGGHPFVRHELLEDLGLAQLTKDTDNSALITFAHGKLVCSMYQSWPEFVRGWKRLFIELSGRKVSRLISCASIHLTLTVFLPLIALCTMLIILLRSSIWHDPLVIATFAAALAALVINKSVMAYDLALGGAPKRAALLLPIAGTIVSWILIQSARDLKNRIPIRWAGKDYIREPRTKDSLARRPRGRKQPIPSKGSMLAGHKLPD